MRTLFRTFIAIAAMMVATGIDRAIAIPLDPESADHFIETDGGESGSDALCQYDPENWSGLGSSSFVPDCISALLYSVRVPHHSYFPEWLSNILGAGAYQRGVTAVIAVDSVENNDPDLEEEEAIRQCQGLEYEVLASCLTRCRR